MPSSLRCVALATCLLRGLACAQSVPEPAITDDVPLEIYLSLLSQVTPAARDGAEAYMAAYEARCGRRLATVALRRAFALGAGDATLLAMVRASQQRDAATIQRLGSQIVCPGS